MVQDPGILYAVLAVAARHLEATSGSEYHNSDEYERKCLGILIPTLDQREIATPQVDATLMSALLLRLLDEMTGESRLGRIGRGPLTQYRHRPGRS